MTSPTQSSVQVAQINVGPLIDNVQVTTSISSAMNRQVVAIGDPAQGGQYALVDAFGRLNVASQSITPTETNPSITSSSSVVLASNSSAKYRFIQNTSSTAVWVSLSGGTATAGSGMLIGPYGSYEMSPGNGNMITGAVNAISTGGTITFYCLEGT